MRIDFVLLPPPPAPWARLCKSQFTYAPRVRAGNGMCPDPGINLTFSSTSRHFSAKALLKANTQLKQPSNFINFHQDASIIRIRKRLQRKQLRHQQPGKSSIKPFMKLWLTHLEGQSLLQPRLHPIHWRQSSQSQHLSLLQQRR